MSQQPTPEQHAEYITDLVKQIALYAAKHRIPFEMAAKPGTGRVYERISISVDVPPQEATDAG